MCAPILLALSLPISACSLTSKPAVLVQHSVTKDRVPASLVKPCPKKQRKPLLTTNDVVNRLIYTEGALAVCAAQIEGIRKWDAGL